MITYSFVVTNTGNVTLTGVTVTDPRRSRVSCPADDRHPRPGRRPDLHRHLHRHPGRHRRRPGRQHRRRSTLGAPRASRHRHRRRDRPVPQVPTLTIVKSGTLDTDVAGPTDRADAGDTITYTFVVTNTGNVTLTGVTVTDPSVDASPARLDGARSLPARPLTCTATYTVTQADIDAGVGRQHRRRRRRRRPRASRRTPTTTPTTDRHRPRSGRSRIDKSGTLDIASTRRPPGQPGDVITYSFDRHQHRQRHPDRRRPSPTRSVTVSCPADTATLAPGETDDLHRHLHHHPGRHRRRPGRQHRRRRRRRAPGPARQRRRRPTTVLIPQVVTISIDKTAPSTSRRRPTGRANPAT